MRRDLLLISALDDHFFPNGYVPRAALAANPRVRLLAVEHGGHVAFISGSLLRPRYWAEDRAAEFVAARLTQ
jgi:predicted alpha/beta-fold hydrolase